MGAVALESIQAIYNALPREYIDNRGFYRAGGAPPQGTEFEGGGPPPAIRKATLKKILEAMDKLFRVRKYCNNELKKISRVYNQCIPFISENFATYSIKFKKKDLGW